MTSLWDLYWAAREGNLALQEEVKKCANINDAKYGDGWTALHWAAWNGNVEAAQVLISNSANVHEKNKNGQTSLVVAVEAGKYEISKEMIKNFGADVNTNFGKDKDTVLHLAIKKASQNTDPKKQKDRDKIVDLLLKHGANYDALNKNL